ncbi:hypothetical protein [Mesorhizobium sp. A623]
MRAAVAFWPLAAVFLAPAPASAAPKCLANGQSFAIGQTACLSVSGKDHLARCEIVLNNTSWTKLHEGCVPGNSDALQGKEKPAPEPAQPGEKPAEPAAN